jgi:hypothetical protein
VCTDASRCGKTTNKPSEAIDCVVPEEPKQHPTKVCVLGETKCSGDELFGCNSEGNDWDLIQSCENGCSGGRCADKPKLTGGALTGMAIVGNSGPLLGALVLIIAVIGGLFYFFRSRR